MDKLNDSIVQIEKDKGNIIAELFRLVSNLTNGGSGKYVSLDYYQNYANKGEWVDMLYITDYTELIAHYRNEECSGNCHISEFSTEELIQIAKAILKGQYQLKEFEEKDFDINNL